MRPIGTLLHSIVRVTTVKVSLSDVGETFMLFVDSVQPEGTIGRLVHSIVWVTTMEVSPSDVGETSTHFVDFV